MSSPQSSISVTPLPADCVRRIAELHRVRQFMSFEALFNEARVERQGSTANGQLIPHSTLNWDDATVTQEAVFDFYNEPTGGAGLFPDDFDAVIAANKGPAAPWNFSDAQWALVPGVPSSVVRVSSKVDFSDGSMRMVIEPAF